MLSAEAEILTSPLLARAGFAHGFATRNGGVSEGPFATLSFARGKEPKEHLAANLERLGRRVGFAPAALFEASQVHGARALRPAAGALPPAMRLQEADAIVLGRAGGAAGVRVADCVPVLMGATKGGGVAAVHAGWRGLVAGIVGAATHELGEGPKVAAIGPSIGACCFEVGDDVADAIARATGEPRVVVRRAAGKAWVDLRLGVRAALRAAGVPDDSIEDVPGCTRCEPARFFSYRRDGDKSGRHLAVIVAGS